jgi:hypothetical protein
VPIISPDFERIRFGTIIDVLVSVPGLERVVLEADDCLYALRESRLPLLSQPTRLRDTLQEPDGGLLGEDAGRGWSVNPLARTLTQVCDDGLRLVDLHYPARPVRSLPLAGRAGRLANAWGDERNEIFLCSYANDIDPVTELTDLCCVEIRTGEMRVPSAVSTAGKTIVRWSKAARTFIVLDLSGQCVWEISPAEKSVRRIFSPDKTESTIIGMTAALDGSLLAVDLLNEGEYRRYVVPGHFEEGRFVWSKPMILWSDAAGGSALHPEKPLLFFEIHGQDRPDCRIVDLGRGVLSTISLCTLAREWVTLGMAWSGQGDKIYLLGDESLLIWRY